MTKINPLISVVMPVFNGEDYLSESIESILTQTYTNFEFIIIDDGSTDSSLAIIESFKKKDNRILVFSRQNKGLIASLNQGCGLARGEYIARMDADDISLPTRFEKQYDLMENKNLDICGCHFFIIDDKGSLESLKLTPINQQTILISLACEVPFAHPSVMFRKSFLEKTGLKYGQSTYITAEDFDLWVRMYYQGARFGNVNDVLFKYRMLKTSLSRENYLGIIQDKKKLNKEFYVKHKMELLGVLDSLPTNLNKEEESLIVRLIYKLFFKSFNITLLKYLRPLDTKIVICTILSELNNR